jgi:hypothetical protein
MYRIRARQVRIGRMIMPTDMTCASRRTPLPRKAGINRQLNEWELATTPERSKRNRPRKDAQVRGNTASSLSSEAIGLEYLGVSNVDLTCSPRASNPLAFGTGAAYLRDTQLYFSCSRCAGQRNRPEVLHRTQPFRALGDIKCSPRRMSLAPSDQTLPTSTPNSTRTVHNHHAISPIGPVRSGVPRHRVR